MRIKFQPMPWLTVFTLICLAILIGLGTWQYQRLQWKTGLIAEIDAAAEAAPLNSLVQSNQLFAANDPLDFRRISLIGEFVQPTLNNRQPFHLMMSDGKSMRWRLFQPFQTGDGIIYVGTDKFDNAEKDSPPAPLAGATTINGYVRLVRSASRFQPVSNPENNDWFVFNGAPETMDWSRAVAGIQIPIGYYIDWIPESASAADLPVKKPELRNHHLDYMLTWYSFALILIVIYLLLHRRQGRLKFET